MPKRRRGYRPRVREDSSRAGAAGLRAVGVNVDGWLSLPHVRFNASSSAEHFYRHAIRFEEMFDQLVLPLRERRAVRLEADYAEETARDHGRHTYGFEDVDVVVLEGVYLLKRAFQHHYDLSVSTSLRRTSTLPETIPGQ